MTEKPKRGILKRAMRALHRASLKSEPQLTIQKMTNNQRNKWARAGYPQDRVEEFMT